MSTGKATPHLLHHRDGSVWAKGQTVGGAPDGYWEWFRKDGTKMRSGYFDRGTQVGDWTTYDARGAVYKVTTMKPKAARAIPKARRAPKVRPGKPLL